MSKYQEELWNKREEIGAGQYVPLFTAMRIIAELEEKLDAWCDVQATEALSYKGPTYPEDAHQEIMQAISRAPRPA